MPVTGQQLAAASSAFEREARRWIAYKDRFDDPTLWIVAPRLDIQSRGRDVEPEGDFVHRTFRGNSAEAAANGFIREKCIAAALEAAATVAPLGLPGPRP